eukprot:6204096-Pleurochrysis_carterae.AAC.3
MICPSDFSAAPKTSDGSIYDTSKKVLYVRSAMGVPENKRSISTPFVPARIGRRRCLPRV